MEESLPANGHDESDRIPDGLLHSGLQPSAQMTAVHIKLVLPQTVEPPLIARRSMQQQTVLRLVRDMGSYITTGENQRHWTMGFYKGAEKRVHTTGNR